MGWRRVIGKEFLRPVIACFAHTIPPAAEKASNHPNYNLLGFSAALAPKFTTELLSVDIFRTLQKQAGRRLKVRKQFVIKCFAITQIIVISFSARQVQVVISKAC